MVRQGRLASSAAAYPDKNQEHSGRAPNGKRRAIHLANSGHRKESEGENEDANQSAGERREAQP